MGCLNYHEHDKDCLIIHTIINQIQRGNLFMSTSLQSDDQTIDQSSFTNMQTLMKQNKIKDLALNKATSLIELLSVELQVQRNNKEDALRQVEQQLRVQFSRQLQGMRQKIQFLERQLKRCNALAVNASNVKTKRQTSLSRSDSSHSLQGRRKHTVNKKYTQINSQEANEEQKKVKIQLAYLQDHFLDIELWKQGIIDELQEVASEDYQQLQEMLTRLQLRYLQLDDVFNESSSLKALEILDDLQTENTYLRQIIDEQKVIINQLKLHTQGVEDILKHLIFKITNFSKTHDGGVKNMDMHDVLLSIKLKIAEGKKGLINRQSCLQQQNMQLKNILDSMIRLVQNDRRINF